MRNLIFLPLFIATQPCPCGRCISYCCCCSYWYSSTAMLQFRLVEVLDRFAQCAFSVCWPVLLVLCVHILPNLCMYIYLLYIMFHVRGFCYINLRKVILLVPFCIPHQSGTASVPFLVYGSLPTYSVVLSKNSAAIKLAHPVLLN